LFGLLSIPFNIWSSFRYGWTPVSAAGVSIGAAFLSLYAALWAWERRRSSMRAEVCGQKQEDDGVLMRPYSSRCDDGPIDWRKISITDTRPLDDQSYLLEMRINSGG
jgi:hypothetical protein